MLRRLGEGSGLVSGSPGHRYSPLDTEDRDGELSPQPPERKAGRPGPDHVPYPKHIFFIISMEACERFSYYGMNAILTIYLITLLKPHYEDEEKANSVATIIYHVFKFGCYGTGLLGATLADSFVGKYRTILYIGMVYCVGQATLAVGALTLDNMPMEAVSYLGITLIAFGTGGIKPCVVALGADQFKMPEQAKQMATYFAMFYASINCGSMVSTLVVPYLRREECLGSDSCFSLAFGLPAGLMLVALLLFWAGSSIYKINIPEENIIIIFFKCSWHALRSRRKGAAGHWLDRAGDRFPQGTIDDIKAVYRVGTLFLFYPMFWALYDQQGSRWTIQAMKMNGQTFGFTLLPDQMQVANPILILILIPLFDQVIYPLLGKVGLLRRPLQRIVLGCFICGLAFVISGVLELQLRRGYPSLPGEGEGKLILHNGAACRLGVSLGELPEVELGRGETAEWIVPRGDHNLAFLSSETCPVEPLPGEILKVEESTNLLVAGQAAYTSTFPDEIKKDVEDTMPSIRLLARLETACTAGWTAKIRGPAEEAEADQRDVVFTFKTNEFKDFPSSKLEETGTYNLSLTCGTQPPAWDQALQEELLQGANYNLALTGEVGPDMVTWHHVTEENSVHIFWLLPQYLVLTVGEILFSITSMEFAYSQAPATMKSVLQAMYLMTTAVGNLITMIIVEIFSAIGWEQYIEFFTFAGLMTLFSIALMAVSYRYEYVYYTGNEEVESTLSTSGYQQEGADEEDQKYRLD